MTALSKMKNTEKGGMGCFYLLLWKNRHAFTNMAVMFGENGKEFRRSAAVVRKNPLPNEQNGYRRIYLFYDGKAAWA